MITKKSFLLYNDFYDSIEDLSDEQVGKLFRAILMFVNTGDEINTEDLIVRVLFKQVKKQISRDLEKYESKCKQLQANASKRKQKQADDSKSKQIGSVTDTVTDNDIKKENKKRKKVPPTLDEVEKYFTEKGYSILGAKEAFEYYENIRVEEKLDHWIDSKGKPITNWKNKMNNVWLKDKWKADANGVPIIQRSMPPL